MKDIKVKTGISGFDELVGGGLPEGRNILISGTPGTGKTIFALQFLYLGAKMFQEKGLYFSFEESSASLKNQARMFGWDLSAMEDAGLLKIVDIAARNVTEGTAQDIVRLVQKFGAKRVVVDSLSTLAINTPTTFNSATEITEISIRRFVYQFINDLRDKGATALLISHAKQGELSSDGVSEFVCDGIIHISYDSLMGKYSRSLVLRKMREVKHDEDVHALEIGTHGVVIHKLKD